MVDTLVIYKEDYNLEYIYFNRELSQALEKCDELNLEDLNNNWDNYNDNGGIDSFRYYIDKIPKERLSTDFYRSINNGCYPILIGYNSKFDSYSEVDKEAIIEILEI
jgi:hypothetical protein